MDGEALRRTEVDGVPVVWSDGDAPLRAGLWFRTGMADATLPTHGWPHLLEHLALHGRDTIRTPVNGRVDLLHTVFAVEGEPNDVVTVLRDLCRWLATPHFGDLEHERRVLRAEAAQRSPGTAGTHLLWRYGAQGPGLGGYDELGLYTAGPDGLRRLAEQYFTAGNAVLALTGPPPAGLRLQLRPGERRAPIAAQRCDQPSPAGFADRPHAVALSSTLPRSSVATTLVRVLQRALQHDLRHRAGVGYSAWSAYELVDADHAMVAAGIDVLPEAVPTAVADTLTTLRRLRDRGPDETEVRDDIEQFVRHLESAHTAEWAPFRAARDLLLDRPVRSAAELAAEARAVTPDDLRIAAGRLWSDLLVSADPASPADPQLTWLRPQPDRRVIEGRTFRPAGAPVVEGELTVGERGTRLAGAENVMTAGYDELAALVMFPDGGRRLIRRDGYQLVVEPGLWRNGGAAVALIDQAVAPGIRVPMPERPAEEVPRNTVTAGQRLKHALGRAWLLPVLVIVPAVGITIALKQVLPDTALRLTLVGLTAGIVVFIQHRYQRGRAR